MANWCDTQYILIGNMADLDAAYNFLKHIAKNPTINTASEFDPYFLGNLLTALGEDYTKIPCRGCWDSLKREDDKISLVTHTAYNPLNEVWDLFCKRFPSLRYFYYAEEDGCEYYATNDVEGIFFPERYLVEYSVDDDLVCHKRFISEDDAVRFANTQSGACDIHTIEVITKDMGKLQNDVIKALNNGNFTITNGHMTINLDDNF